MISELDAGPFVGVVAVIVLLTVGRYLYRVWNTPRRRRHRYHVRQAKKVIKRLSQIPNFGQRMAYLRKIDPLTFEELLLEAAERRGHHIYRNKRYSGDGGIDGRIEMNGELVLVQAKLYNGYIKPEHVYDFRRLINESGCYGLFCHTGKTSQATNDIADTHRLKILGGDRLLKFIDVPQKH